MTAPPDPDDWLILETANEHGIVDDDLVHAIDNYMTIWRQDDAMTMFIGPTRTGRLIEVGTIEWHGITAIVHGMPARPKYL